MSEYYKAKQKMFIHLERIVNSCKETKTDIDLKTILYDLTLTFAVSEKSINKRIEQLVELRKDLKLEKDVLRWVK